MSTRQTNPPKISARQTNPHNIFLRCNRIHKKYLRGKLIPEATQSKKQIPKTYLRGKLVFYTNPRCELVTELNNGATIIHLHVYKNIVLIDVALLLRKK